MNRLEEIENKISKLENLSLKRLRDPFLYREEIHAADGTKIQFSGDSSPELASYFHSIADDVKYLVEELKARV